MEYWRAWRVDANTNWESLRIEGVPDSNIPACSSCHGADAEGGAGLRLAGQLYDYAFKTIMNWSKERRQDPADPDSSAVMTPIAGSPTETQILAVPAVWDGAKSAERDRKLDKRRRQ